MKKTSFTYAEAILSGFEYLLDNHDEVFIIGQGLWSPWYVGKTMDNLEIRFGKERIIDTPVSESACTGAAVGASIIGMKPIVIHPRMDFMLYALDSIVNEAAKWSSMFGGQSNAGLTVRGIINRGGEQGAQHSQALHSWFSHIPGLRVVMPYSVQDARDLLISSVISDDPVIYIDDRWLYESVDILKPYEFKDINLEIPKKISEGKDLTIVGIGYTNQICLRALDILNSSDISADIIDMRILNPMRLEVVFESIKKTRRLLVVDGGWPTCGVASEIIAAASEKLPINTFIHPPKRVTLTNAPAPTSFVLEKDYYPNQEKVIKAILNMKIKNQ